MKKYLKLLVIASVMVSLIVGIRHVYSLLRPIEVVDYVESPLETFTYLVLNERPASPKRFIKWWQANRQQLIAQYDIPDAQALGRTVDVNVFIMADEGYLPDVTGDYKPGLFTFLFESEHYDMVCFDEVEYPNKCLDKHRLFAVIELFSDGLQTNYVFYHSSVSYDYLEKANGVIEKVERPVWDCSSGVCERKLPSQG